MSAKKKKEQIRPYNSWWCVNCATSEEMTLDQYMAHLRDIHNVDTNGLKCRKSMLMHLDGDTWFSWKYDVTVLADGQELKAINETRDLRKSSFGDY